MATPDAYLRMNAAGENRAWSAADFETRFVIDHAGTVSPRNIERSTTLGGDGAIQHRMAFQGEYFIERYGAEVARATPPAARRASSTVGRSGRWRRG